MCVRTGIVIIIILIIFSSIIISSQIDKREKEICAKHESIRQEFENLNKDKNIITATTFIIGLSGFIIVIIQSTGKKKFKKIAISIVGGIISFLTFVNSTYFDGDYHYYKKKCQNVNVVLIKYNTEYAKYIGSKDPNNFTILSNLLTDAERLLGFPPITKSNISNIDEKSDNLENEDSSKFLLFNTQLYAYQVEKNYPSWIKIQPNNKDNLYFLGSGTDTNFYKAKYIAEESALENIINYFDKSIIIISTKPNISTLHIVDPFKDMIKQSAIVDKYYYTYNTSTHYYEYYMLFKIIKKEASFLARFTDIKSSTGTVNLIREIINDKKNESKDYYSYRKNLYEVYLQDTENKLKNENNKFELARYLRRNKEYEESIRLFEELINKYPNVYMVWYNLALAYHSQFEKFSLKAKEAYRKALELEKDQKKSDPSIYNTYGYFLFENGDFINAGKYLCKSLESTPNHPLAKNTLLALQDIVKLIKKIKFQCN